ncbi:hypothetical protein [Mesorhizobium sp. M2A.F.Ca.ET.039.01.1.1]|uniref:hypothetical protein n=1 Tax=Mesorhizobium sp. M2A.F.Ca.ET.039.01.1.1 TaxID=2496746 RepID=UPI000FCA22D1|nr:hypothetical protein [Mesorhizobium sp. M2A.F.Ca.ET.039.01.1.1]RWX72571.1 hypothetical protein EOA24_00845 [Mesorhizobium sp. M2A.F.Ca.ET.039.01.1.1]
MARYVTANPAAAWWDEAKASDYLARTVHEDERKPVATGLLDANGAKLFRVEDRQPIGFVHHKA